MQTFATHALHNQTNVDPSSNPTLLATIIIPHLEAYLVANTATRFLIIHYSATQLSIILALRDLLGSSLFKVAGILDGRSSDQPSFGTEHPQIPTRNALLSQATGSHLAIHKMLQEQCKSSSLSFSKANYLLPSTATDREIITFLSEIWKSLIETDSFYIPELEPPVVSKVTILNSPTATPHPPSIPSTNFKPTSPRTPPHTSISSLSKVSGKDHGSPKRNQPRANTFRAEKNSHGRPARSQTQRTNSYVSSICSGKTTASSRERQSEREWADFYIGEDDSEDDAYDRMVLGRAGVIPGKTVYGEYSGRRCAATGMNNSNVKKRPGYSKKALKWLGLA